MSAKGEGSPDCGMFNKLTWPSDGLEGALTLTAGADRKGVKSQAVLVVVGISEGARSAHVVGLSSAIALGLLKYNR